MAYSEFATDPCRSLFKRFTTSFTEAQYGANANITTGRIGDQFVAQMESRMPVAFVPQTLDTIGVVGFDDQLKGEVKTAHPHHDPDEGAAYNFLLKFGTTSAYDVYRLPDASTTREVVGRATTKRPSYIHSLGLDKHFPGEPVFIARPDATTEDEGVLLTVVLDARQNTSYLLVLDARDLSEIARAHVPQHIPFGFHGTYTRAGSVHPAVR